MRKTGLDLSLKQELTVFRALREDLDSFARAYVGLREVETEELFRVFSVTRASTLDWMKLYISIIDHEIDPMRAYGFLGAFPELYASQYMGAENEELGRILARAYLLSRAPHIDESISSIEKKIKLQERAERQKLQYFRTGPPPLEELGDKDWIMLDGGRLWIPVFLRNHAHGARSVEFIKGFWKLTKEQQDFIMKESLLGSGEGLYLQEKVYRLYIVVRDLLFLVPSRYGDPEDYQTENATGKPDSVEKYRHELETSQLEQDNAKTRQHIYNGLTPDEKAKFGPLGPGFLSGARVVRGVGKVEGLPPRESRKGIISTGPRARFLRAHFPQTDVTATYHVAGANNGKKKAKKATSHGRSHSDKIRGRQTARLERLRSRPFWAAGERISQRTDPVPVENY